MKLAGKTVAVTGASGFVGHYVVRVLLERGAHVVAVLRNPDAGLQIEDDRIELRRGDITNLSTMEHALDGADALVANAALISIGGHSKETLQHNNEVGTKNTFIAAAANGIKRTAFTSSASVYRPRRDHHYREHHKTWDWKHRPLRPRYYGVSKAHAERIAQRISDRYKMGLSIARPHMIYGAYCRDGFSAWFERYTGHQLPVSIAGWRYPTVYAGDLADALCRMLEADSAVGQTYNISNEPAAHSFQDHVKAWAESEGFAAPKARIRIPMPVMRRYNIDKAKRDLDWTNRPLVDGYREIKQIQEALG